MSSATVLVVDDDAAVVEWLVEALTERGFSVEGTTSARAAVIRTVQQAFDLVIADVEMPEMRGLDFVATVHQRRPQQLVLLITAFGSIELAMQAIRAGACDFVAKPFRVEMLVFAMERALRERRMVREIVRLRSVVADNGVGLVANSASMRRALEVADRAAQSLSNVMLTGESGCGKGTIAKYIHERGPRAIRPWVQVNCGALPLALVESELFGVKKGAFTDAREDRPGLLASAHTGTLFLDEVGELPMESQPKLLHVLENRAVRAVGATEERPLDVRLISATNVGLEQAVAERKFRADLFFRLDVIRIALPPLRERREDLEGLVDQLLARNGRLAGRPILGISSGAMRKLMNYDWPGNVRELANTLERAVALSDHDTLLAEDILLPGGWALEERSLEAFAKKGSSLEDVERAYLEAVLESVEGNKLAAAKILGIDRRTLYRKLEGGS